jgi:hypothetical protein
LHYYQSLVEAAGTVHYTVAPALQYSFITPTRSLPIT